MDASKPNRRKSSAKKLEPIDWHEFANDAVLHGNMSTLYHRPPNEDATAYASSEALVEIEKRVGRSSESPATPTVGTKPAAGLPPTAGIEPTTLTLKPTVGTSPTQGFEPIEGPEPTAGWKPTPVPEPTAGFQPTVGLSVNRKVRPIRDVSDALTLAGQVLYRAMSGAPGDAGSTLCAKGYRQLAAQTHLDKDTVRDLIVEFKDKGMVREIATYDPDTRSSKTYEVLSNAAILQMWREAGIAFVTTGRQRPAFCTAQGQVFTLKPTVGVRSSAGRKPTVGPEPSVDLDPR